jgi:hypothetical protein
LAAEAEFARRFRRRRTSHGPAVSITLITPTLLALEHAAIEHPAPPPPCGVELRGNGSAVHGSAQSARHKERDGSASHSASSAECA